MFMMKKSCCHGFAALRMYASYHHAYEFHRLVAHRLHAVHLRCVEVDAVSLVEHHGLVAYRNLKNAFQHDVELLSLV